VRESLIRTRTKYISLISALARREGCRIKAGPSPSFARCVEQAGLPAHTLMQIEPLLVMLKALNEQIKAADKRLDEIAGADEVVRRLCSVPGVGPVVATTFASTLDDASRFLGAKHVRSYLELVPRECSSGERQRRGRISKAGSSRARSLLVEAVWSLLRWKTERTKALHEWWARIAQRRGRRRPWWRWRGSLQASCSRSGGTARSLTRGSCVREARRRRPSLRPTPEVSVRRVQITGGRARLTGLARGAPTME
jgi:transposase